jgi:hypothetical protein
MNTLIVGLSLAGAVAAQAVNGVSMVPAYQANYGSSDASSSTTAYDSTYTSSVDMSGQGYYSTFMSGGYKSMNCGYGYSKNSDGSCSAESWWQTSGCYETIIINK